MRILCIMVLYHPNMVEVKKKVQELQQYVDKVVLWDNTVNNIGLSKAYNEGWHQAVDEGYDYLMTMDQDSTWHHLGNYISAIQSYEKEHPMGQNLFFASTVPNDIDYQEIYHGGINSGAVVPISLLNSIHGYRADFFVDAIDDWLQLRATKEGYHNILVGNTQIIQRYGEPLRKTLLGRKFASCNYSPMRLYGVMRNYMILYQEFLFPTELKHKFFYDFLTRWSLKVLLLEDRKWAKIKAVVYGLWDGLLRNPSRISLFMK